MTEIAIIGIEGIPSAEAGDDLVSMLLEAADFEDHDVLVVAHKIVSKVEGRVVDLREVEPSPFARRLAGSRDAREVEVILRESRRIVRMREGFVICETEHGFVCASAGVDMSNAPGDDLAVLLPRDSDASAERLRRGLEAALGIQLAVIVSDSFGRAWRRGSVDVAVGVSGMLPLLDLRGRRDPNGYVLQATQIALADELASAAELAMGKVDEIPAAIIRGLKPPEGDAPATDLVIPAERDLFR